MSGVTDKSINIYSCANSSGISEISLGLNFDNLFQSELNSERILRRL